MNTEGDKMWNFRPHGQVVLFVFINCYSANRLSTCWYICHLEMWLWGRSWKLQTGESSFHDKMVPSIIKNKIKEHRLLERSQHGLCNRQLHCISHFTLFECVNKHVEKKSHWTSKNMDIQRCPTSKKKLSCHEGGANVTFSPGVQLPLTEVSHITAVYPQLSFPKKIVVKSERRHKSRRHPL